MNHLVSPEIENYCRDHSTPQDAALKPLVEETIKSMERPQMQVGHLEGNFLRTLVRITRAKRVLEVGTFTGYSSLLMAEGLPEDGKIITLDIDPVSAKIAHKYWDKFPYGKKIEQKLGPALDSLRNLEGPFDLAFIDADKENYIHYWEAILPKIRQGGLVIADNVLWGGSVLKPEDESDFAIVNFNAHIHKDPRVEIVMLSVRDGMSLCWKK